MAGAEIEHAIALARVSRMQADDDASLWRPGWHAPILAHCRGTGATGATCILLTSVGP